LDHQKNNNSSIHTLLKNILDKLTKILQAPVLINKKRKSLQDHQAKAENQEELLVLMLKEKLQLHQKKVVLDIIDPHHLKRKKSNNKVQIMPEMGQKKISK
jgi:hypothetical protein